jgi:MFS family permease
VGVGGALLILPFALAVVRERPDSGAAGEGSAPADDSGLDVAAALRTRSFWVLALALFGFFFYLLGVLEHLIASLTDSGMPRTEAAGYFSAAIGLGLVSKVVMGAAADRLSPRPAILVDYGLLVVSSFLLLLLPEKLYLQLFVVLFGFSYAARDVVYPLAIAECFGVRQLAPIYGLLMVVLAPAGSLGGIFAGAVQDRTGSYALAFQVFAVVNVLIFASLFLLRDERERERKRV